jgi:sulfatase modifying factor 1
VTTRGTDPVRAELEQLRRDYEDLRHEVVLLVRAHEAQREAGLSSRRRGVLASAGSAAESLLKFVVKREGLDRQTKKAESLMLDELITKVKEHVPEHVQTHLRTVQAWRNQGAHDKGDIHQVTSAELQQVDTALARVMIWFFGDYLGDEFADLAARLRDASPREAKPERAEREAKLGEWREAFWWAMRSGAPSILEQKTLEAIQRRHLLTDAEVESVRVSHRRKVEELREVLEEAAATGDVAMHAHTLEHTRLDACVSEKEAEALAGSLATLAGARVDAPGWLARGAGRAAEARAEVQGRAAKADATARAEAEERARAAQAKAEAEAWAKAEAQARARVAAAEAKAAAEERARLDAWRQWVGARVVRVPAGAYQRGQASGGDSDERPVHRVTLTRAFELWRTPLTQDEWRQLMGNNPSEYQGATRPVERVSWYDAVAWCNALSRATGLDEAYVLQGAKGKPGEEGLEAGVSWKGLGCGGWRLPTEAEWEYACRAGSTGERYGELDAVAWHWGNSGGATHPVGQKQPNAWGLCDTLGNVWEWCWDWRGDYPAGAVTDPTGPAEGQSRVYRGGCFDLDADCVRAAYRSDYDPSFHDVSLGFRPTRSLP